MVAALPSLPRLRELELALRRAVTQSAAEGLATACATCTQLSSLDLHFPVYTQVAPTVPAWAALAALTGMRSLHASSGMGWDGAALAAVAAAATSLRSVTLTDNVGNAVDAKWIAALAPLQRLSHLQLNSCRKLREEAVPLLCLLSSLTCLHGFRCPGLSNEEARLQLRASLPCLADLSLHE